MPVISGLTFSVTASTIVATWTTDVAADSNLTAGGKAAIDNGIAANSTSHQCIVTGLSPNTSYSCVVTSGGSSSSPQNVTTSALDVRTPINSVNIGAFSANTGINGDYVYNFVSNDGKCYNTLTDGHGWPPGGINAGANMQFGVFTKETGPFQATVLNLWTNYGGWATSNGTDGPGGGPLTNKCTGMFGMLGNLYVTQCRVYSASQPYQVFFANVIKSQDKGATWNSWQTPSTYNANGTPPSPLGSSMFSDSTIGSLTPIRYGVDDGTMGYNTAGNQIDGANGWVYLYYTDGYVAESSKLYLTRVSRIEFDAQVTTAFQWWIGPSSPTASDFVNDSNWQANSETGATPIYTAANQVGTSSLTFIPALNYYLLLTWYRPSPTVTSSSVWKILAAPTPAGPWTTVQTASYSPQAYYNAQVLHRTAATNTRTSDVQLYAVCSGDYQNPTYYSPTGVALTLNPTSTLAYVQSAINPQAASATTNVQSVLAYASNITGGNLLVAIADLSGPSASATGVSISDTAGNTTWTPAYGSIQEFVGASTNVFYQIWYCLNAKAGSNADTVTVQWTNPTNSFGRLSVFEYAGFTSADVLDLKPFGTVTSGTAMPTLSFPTTKTREVLSVVGVTNGTPTANGTVGGDFTLGVGSTNLSIVTGYSVQPAIGTYTFSGAFNVPPANLGWAIGVSISATIGTVATPTFSPVAGSYSGIQSVTVSCATSGAIGFAMYFTIDGSTPTTSSTLYTGPISVSTSQTIKVLATATNYDNSAIASATYLIATVWSPVDSRQAVPGLGPGPNGFRTVQGSNIYDVQTSSNSRIPPVDSRVSKPVDCRVSAPQNSRVAPK